MSARLPIADTLKKSENIYSDVIHGNRQVAVYAQRSLWNGAFTPSVGLLCQPIADWNLKGAQRQCLGSTAPVFVEHFRKCVNHLLAMGYAASRVSLATG